MSYPLLKSLEEVLLSGQACVVMFYVEYEDGGVLCYENIIQMKEIDNIKIIYDLITDEPSDMQLDEIGGYRILGDKETDVAVQQGKKLLEYATPQFPDMSPQEIQNKISNYLLSYKQRAQCVYFGIPVHDESNVGSLFKKHLPLVKQKLKQDLMLRCHLEKQKILNEMEELKSQVDEETFKDIQSHSEHISEWLDGVVVDLPAIDKKSNMEEILSAWPVIFAPAPWEIFHE